MPSIVHDCSTGKTKQVKNLGWLLRHATEVDYFTIYPLKCGKPDAMALIAQCGVLRYETDYQSLKVMFDFLARPAFFGKRVDIHIENHTWTGAIGDMQYEVFRQNAKAAVGLIHALARQTQEM